MEKQIVLVVDDELNNIKLLNGILGSHYTVRAATNAQEALERAQITPYPDLILLDIMMPGINGYEVCRRLKANIKTAKIPVIFITAKNETQDEELGFKAGAVDYISKPVSPSIVMARASAHISLANQQKACEKIVTERTAELQETQKAAINMLGEAGHYNDNDTGVHIWRMASYARALAQAANWPVDKARMLELAAPMHDTGKIGIPDSILKAPRSLSSIEWTTMKEHTRIGHSILSKSKTGLFTLAADIALHHHEKWDGTGYPKNIKGEYLSEAVRIISIVDVFDALTTKRSYKESWPIDKAVAEIEKGAGKHFDPFLVHKFITIIPTILKIKEHWEILENNDILPEIVESHLMHQHFEKMHGIHIPQEEKVVNPAPKPHLLQE